MELQGTRRAVLRRSDLRLTDITSILISICVRYFHKAVYSLGKWTRRYTDRQNGRTAIQTGKMNEPVKIKSSDRRPEINKSLCRRH